MLNTWQQRLAHIVDMMREISFQTEPAAITDIYQKRIRAVEQYDRYVSVSRRDLAAPWYRVTRDSNWPRPRDPWKERDQLPLLRGGILAEILYANEPRLLVDARIDPEDPAAPYLAGYRTIIAVPHYDQGEALNWVVHLRRDADYDPEQMPELVWLSNLFGRMTYGLVLAGKLRSAHDALDAELKLVADVQRSLIGNPGGQRPGLRTAVFSQPARRAGGDYVAVLPLEGGRTGLFIADASGHSAPATVLMAMVHTLLRLCPRPEDPAECLGFIDRGLRQSAAADRVSFATGFFGVFDPEGQTLTYARAGHPPPRLCGADGSLRSIDAVGDLPLGLNAGASYESATLTLSEGDMLVCFTDGLTDIENAAGETFDIHRLDASIAAACRSAGYPGDPGSRPGKRQPDPQRVVDSIQRAAIAFSGETPPQDDCSLLVAAVG